MCSLGVSDTGSPAAVIPGRDVSYLTSTPQHTHLCINFPKTTGADRTEPHTSNVRSTQGLSGQRKDLGISLLEVAWRSYLLNKKRHSEVTILTAKQVTSFIFHHNLKR